MTAPPRSRRAVLLRLTARLLLGLPLLLGALLLVGWLALRWFVLPHIEDWRQPIAQRVSRSLGATVQIGAIQVDSGGWVPTIEVRDVQVLDPQQRVALTLPRVVASVSARSLLSLDLRFNRFSVEAPSLDIRRDAAGHVRVAGLDLGNGAPGSSDVTAAADWLFRQHEFLIHGGSVHWIDEQRSAMPLALTEVDLELHNGLRGHQVRLGATPPAGWGERLTVEGRFNGPLLARAGNWQRWSGTATADLPHIDVGELRRYVDLPFDFSAGQGSLHGTYELRAGLPQSATVDVALRAVTLRLGARVEALQFEQLAAHVVAQRKSGTTSLQFSGLSFVTADGLRWPNSRLDVSWHQAPGQDPDAGQVQADRLDLGVMAAIAGRVPLGAAIRRLLADAAPQGIVTGLDASWDGPLDAPAHYRVRGRLAGLAFNAGAVAPGASLGRPGLRGADVQFDARDTGGQAQVGVTRGAVNLPGVFADELVPLDSLQASLAWQIDKANRGDEPPHVVVTVSEARFANPDAHGEFRARWQTGSGSSGIAASGGRYPGLLELDGSLGEGQALRTARYLPLGLAAGVRSYIAAAVRGGRIATATFHVKGDLRDFPFRPAQNGIGGEFRIIANVEDLSFAYLPGSVAGDPAARPGWPALTSIAGVLDINRASLAIRQAQARLDGVQFSGIEGRIDSLDNDPRLRIAGQASGPLADMVRFVDATPIGGWIGGALAQATTSGPARLQLELAVPIAEPAATSVKGSLRLAGNDIRMTPDSPPLAGARGVVDFTQGGFTVSGASARVLGGELSFQGSGQGHEKAHFSGHGTVTARGLHRAAGFSPVARLAASLSGQAGYQLSLAFPGGSPQLELSSDLVGLGIALPYPLGKGAATPLALRLRSTTAPASATGTAGASTRRETSWLELGRVLQARIERDTGNAAAGPAQPLRAVLRVSDAGVPASAAGLTLPGAGVGATVDLDHLDLDAWQAASAGWFPDPAGPSAKGPAQPPEPASAPLALPVALPATVALRIGTLTVSTHRLTGLSADVKRQDGLWHAGVTATELAGTIDYRPDGVAGGPAASLASGAGSVVARLSRLKLPRAEAEAGHGAAKAAVPPSAEPPAKLPALDIVAEQFDWGSTPLGRLEIQAGYRPGAADGPWRISKLELDMPEARFTASGAWTARAAAQPAATKLDFKLALSDAGAFLERLGLGPVVRGGQGTISGDVTWPGSPFALEFSQLNGGFRLAVDKGQFLKASPGFGRLLGILSLQSLPRRLLLDFRDVFDTGWAFDSAIGDFTVTAGVAKTNNLRLAGVAATVLLDGQADVDRETQDLHIVVVPEVNAGAASLAYAIINPAVGVGTFLAQFLLRNPLMAANTREFHVTGPWSEPKVARVNRGKNGQAPSETPVAADDAASAAVR